MIEARMLEMWLSGEKVRTTGSAVTISAAVVGVLWYFARLDGRISQLEEQMRSVATTVLVADRLNGRVAQLEEQMRFLAGSSNTTTAVNNQFNGRVAQLKEKVRSLAASSAATTATITEISKKPSAGSIQYCKNVWNLLRKPTRGSAPVVG